MSFFDGLDGVLNEASSFNRKLKSAENAFNGTQAYSPVTQTQSPQIPNGKKPFNPMDLLKDPKKLFGLGIVIVILLKVAR